MMVERCLCHDQPVSLTTFRGSQKNILRARDPITCLRVDAVQFGWLPAAWESSLEENPVKQKMVVCIVAALCGLFGSTFAMAAEQWTGGTVQYIYPMGNGDFLITFATPPAACTGPSPKYLRVVNGQLGVTPEGVRAMLAVALTAHATGKPLHVVFDDATANCYVSRLLIDQ